MVKTTRRTATNKTQAKVKKIITKKNSPTKVPIVIKSTEDPILTTSKDSNSAIIGNITKKMEQKL